MVLSSWRSYNRPRCYSYTHGPDQCSQRVAVMIARQVILVQAILYITSHTIWLNFTILTTLMFNTYGWSLFFISKGLNIDLLLISVDVNWQWHYGQKTYRYAYCLHCSLQCTKDWTKVKTEQMYKCKFIEVFLFCFRPNDSLLNLIVFPLERSQQRHNRPTIHFIIIYNEIVCCCIKAVLESRGVMDISDFQYWSKGKASPWTHD